MDNRLISALLKYTDTEFDDYRNRTISKKIKKLASMLNISESTAYTTFKADGFLYSGKRGGFINQYKLYNNIWKKTGMQWGPLNAGDG